MTYLKASSSKELKLELETTMSLCQLVDSARSLTVYLMLKYGEFSQYLELSIDPSNYEDVSAFRRDLLVTKVLSKSPNLPVTVDRVAAAVTTFLDSETRCKAMNDSISLNWGKDYPWFNGFCHLISKVLPPLSEGVLESILAKSCHGPGSTTGVRSIGQSVVEKYQKRLELTANLIPFSRSIMGELWWKHNSAPREVVRGSRFTTVPKTAKTDRGICVEPTLNVFIQKGIGAVIRSRLRRFGLDLDRQAENNAYAASQAHIDELSTLDLSAASDSMSCRMLERVLPPDWYHLLMITRSPEVKILGQYRRLEKISSMGNGYTFELESLIFWALARSIVPYDEWHNVHVFGDDIIIPRKYAHQVIAALNVLGFSVNGSKSFLDGNFFESCGTDWFKGHPVRPFYLKGQKDHIPYAVQIANKLRLYSSLAYRGQWCDSSFRPLWLNLLKSCPKTWRECRVPSILGDVGIITSYAELKHRRPLDASCKWEEGYYIKTVHVSPKKRRYQSYGILLDAIASGAPERATKGLRVLRGLFGKTRTSKVRLTTWPSGLEWDLRI